MTFEPGMHSFNPKRRHNYGDCDDLSYDWSKSVINNHEFEAQDVMIGPTNVVNNNELGAQDVFIGAKFMGRELITYVGRGA